MSTTSFNIMHKTCYTQEQKYTRIQLLLIDVDLFHNISTHQPLSYIRLFHPWRANFSLIQGNKFLMWVYTPGVYCVPHLVWPQDTIPIATCLPVG